jgi:hypothetical protein
MCFIDDTMAGKYRDEFRRAAERFCRKQSSKERFRISSRGSGPEGVQVVIQRRGDRYSEHRLVVAPAEDMEGSIFAALEQWSS